MNGYGWLSFPTMSESLNHDFAIRRFCPARLVEQQPQLGKFVHHDDYFSINEINDLVNASNTNSTTTCLSPYEEDQFVHSFFNNIDDAYNHNHNNESPPQDHHHHHHNQLEAVELDFNYSQDHHHHHQHQHQLANFSTVNNIYGEDTIDPMMIAGYHHDDDYRLEMMSTFFEDFGAEVVSEEYIVTSNSSSELVAEDQESSHHRVDQGLQLVHLLLACAEAVGCRDTQLAHSILSQISASATPWGDSLQRVSYCFAAGLKSRLSILLQNVNPNGTFSFTNTSTSTENQVSPITRQEKAEAFQLLHQTTPYVAFGFTAANDAICQAAQGKDFLHIVDLGTEVHALLQWPSLIRTLASRPEGPPKLLRITGLVGDKIDIFELEAVMKGIIDEATSLGIPLEFQTILEPATPSLFTSEHLNMREGEALFVNSMMHLHKYIKESRGSLKMVLQAIKKLGPTLLTVVEQDANHNGPFFLGRFLESLHYYSAIFDSLEASLPRNSPQRMKIEKHHFAEEIRNIVACEGPERTQRHERADQWRRQLGRAGFQGVGLKCKSQVRTMLSVYGCDEYSLGSEKGCLLLGWKGRPIMLASAWQLYTAAAAAVPSSSS